VPEDSENATLVAEFVEHQRWLIVLG
jgi:hypothetical protein